MNMNRVISVSIAVLSGVLLGAGYISTQPQSSAANVQSKDSDVKVSGSVATIYKSMGGMVPDADLIVTGSFTGEQVIVSKSKLLDLPPRESEKSPAPLRDPNLIHQVELGHIDSGFNISEVIKGQATTKVYVAQRGSIAMNSKVTPMSGDRFFKGGDSYILFLKKPLPHEIKNAGGRSFYYLVGAYQGSYRIKDGRVYTRDIEDLESAKISSSEPSQGYGYRINGTDTGTVLKELRSLSRL